MLTLGNVAQVTLAFALPTSIVLVYWWYKNRSDDDDVYGKRRFVTSRNTVIEVKVPQHAVGAVIGRQGSKIKEVQKETGASLHFQNKDSCVPSGDDDASCQPHRVLVIRGPPEAVHQAELLVYQVIAVVPQIFTEDIEVPAYVVGRIIGKGGATIKEISAISEARISIDRNEGLKNQDNPRTITLSGSRKQIDTALELIQIKLEEEEQFRTRFTGTPSDKEQRSDQKPEPVAKIIAVPRSDESWDESNNASSPGQENVQNDAYTKVYVSAVEHPGHFWLQMIGNEALHLDQLQNDITHFVCSEDARLNYTVTEVNLGDLVAARFEDSDGVYYRAKVLGEVDGGKVDLYFVDFGDNAYADKEDIFRLRSDFTKFPFQAIECILANVTPVGGKWSEEAITLFEDLTHCARWKYLLARVVTYKNLRADQKTLVVQLFDRSETEDVDIGAELVKQGYALSLDSLDTNKNSSLAGDSLLETSLISNSGRSLDEVALGES